jgi:hypothetical protein
MIEILKDNGELVGFYRKDKPIGSALMVDAEQMAVEYENLEAEIVRHRKALQEIIDLPILYEDVVTDSLRNIAKAALGGMK